MKQMPGWRSRLHCLWALIGLVVVMDANAVPGAVTYVYDDAGRLRNTSFVCAATTYVLDAAGNRTSVQATTSNTVQFGAATYSVSEANASVTISVLRSCGSSAAVSVGYTLGGTATPTTDYTVSGTLSWAAGDAAPKSLTLTTQDNTVYAPNKTAILTLSAPTGGASIGSPSTTTVTIVENDPQPVPGAVQFTASSLSVSEGTAHAQLTLTRAGAAGAVPAASVICTPANGTAVGGSDFTAGAQSIHWAANDVSNKTCSIPILNDTIFESSETFTVALSAPTGGMTLGSPTTSTVTITDNDGISFSIANVAVNEAAGTATLTVTKTGVTSMTHAVNYATANGTASAGSDYTAASGTLTFAPAEMTKTFTVAITNDTVYEGNETFAINLSAPTNGAVIGTGSATVTLQDNDPAPSFSINSVSVNETAGSATLTVTKSGSTVLTHAVSYASANGSATAGADYTAVSGTLSFTSGETSKTITVSILDDTLYESSESFSVNLSAPTQGASLGTASGTVTLLSNDPPPSLSVYGGSVNESAGTVTVSVEKSGSTGLTHAVNYTTVSGTAVSGADFTATSGTLTFAPAETIKTFTVAIINDSVAESTEYFSIQLSAPTNGATLGAGLGVIGIVDDDIPAVPGSVQFSGVSPSASVLEPVGSVTLTLSRTGASGPFGAASVVCATSNGTAIAGSDYVAVSQTITWAAGDSSPKSCVVPIIDDTQFELHCASNPNFPQPGEMPIICTRDEYFYVYLSNVSGMSLGSPMSMTITINDGADLP
jgi:azurin